LVTGRKLLLADDSATIQKVVDLTFTDEGLEVITVGDGQQAVEMLEEVVPDIVLADVFMPGLSGYEVCEHIKQSERFRHIPVMLLVGSFEPFDEAEARRVGADDYLTKPFQSIRTLIGKVGNLLSGGGSTEDATTRRLIPPPEAVKENRPEADFLERSTANTAPLPQHEREESEREVPFTDLSMDDEMIETMPGDNYVSGSHAEHVAQTRPTAQYTAADLKEAGIATPAAESAAAPEQQEAVGAYAPAQTVEPVAAATGSQSQPASRASSLAATDDSLLDLDDFEPPASMAEADDFILDLRDEELEQTWQGAPGFAEALAPPVETAEEGTTEAQSQAQEFVEPQVLGEESGTDVAPVEEDASPVAGFQPAEAGSVSAREEVSSDAQLAPTERLPDNYQVEEAASVAVGAESSTNAATPLVTGRITLEQLSPEVIDAIARRAVEQLSERVVEQIAWEVVPDLALLLIKRRLDEEKS
jgi:CheY-like chemotaxis protein